MTIFYSPATGWFYDTDWHGTNVPEDAIETTADKRDELLAATCNGKVISVGEDGALLAVEPALSVRKAALISQFDAACQSVIYAGFSSAALGADHFYPTADLDQRNLQSAVLAGQGQASAWATPVWCRTGDEWTFAAHSAAQLAQVNADWVAHRVSAQQRYVDLVAQVNAATEDQLSTITW